MMKYHPFLSLNKVLSFLPRISRMGVGRVCHGRYEMEVITRYDEAVSLSLCRWKNWWIRGVLSLVMISLFFLIIYMGSFMLMLLVSLLDSAQELVCSVHPTWPFSWSSVSSSMHKSGWADLKIKVLVRDRIYLKCFKLTCCFKSDFSWECHIFSNQGCVLIG